MRAGTFTSIVTDIARLLLPSLGRMLAPSRLPRVLAGLLLTAVLAGCAGTSLPASVTGGECRVFARPEFAVRGKTKYDQNWVDDTVESGVGGCGWQRPAARPPALDAAPSVGGPAVVAVPLKRASLMSRTFGHIRKKPKVKPGVVDPVPSPTPRPVNIVVPDVIVAEPEPEVAPSPPAPPRAPVDELLSPTQPMPPDPPKKRAKCRIFCFGRDSR
jgi:hypothetical protein